MESTQAQHEVCGFCGIRSATKKYVHPKLERMACEECFDLYSVRDALDDNLLQISDLEERGQFDEALARLDEILTANRARDHDGWLANSVALHRASILGDAGRHAEAEQAYKEWAQIGFIDRWRQQMHALGLAQALEAMGRDAEVPKILESALGNEEPKDLPLALKVLTELIRFSEKTGAPFNPKWLSVAEAIAKEEGLEMPLDPSPTAAILALEKAVEHQRREADPDPA